MVIVWFLFIGGIGLFNMFKYDVGVLRALNPKYIVDYFKRNGKKGWISLGGIFLCITGEWWHQVFFYKHSYVSSYFCTHIVG